LAEQIAADQTVGMQAFKADRVLATKPRHRTLVVPEANCESSLRSFVRSLTRAPA
jgi:hypothetical protein